MRFEHSHKFSRITSRDSVDFTSPSPFEWIGVRLNQLKFIIPLLLLAICIASCNSVQNKDGDNVESTHTAIVEKDVSKCMPHDTTAANGIFVKYVKYDSTYGLIVGRGKWQAQWRDDIDCSFDRSAVPTYEWSSDKVIAIANGCAGKNCSKQTYFNINTTIINRRENVFAHDGSRNLIVYFTDNYCLTIENIHNGRKAEYSIEEKPAGPSYAACTEKGQFSKDKLTFEVHLVVNNGDSIVSESFTIPEKLNQ